MVDSNLDVTKGIPQAEQQAAKQQAARLSAQDPVLLRQIAAGFRAATRGALEPTVKVVAATKRLTVTKGSCLELGMQDQLVEAAARPQHLQGALNIVVVKAPICSNAQGENIAGYDSPDGMPVVGWVSLAPPWELVHNMIHEYGHDA